MGDPSTIGLLVLVLVVIFLRKYHAGEVGVETALVLFVSALALGLVLTAITTPEMSQGTQFGGASATTTAFMMAMFRALFLDVGGVMLTNGWDTRLRKQVAEHFQLNHAELESRPL